MLQITRQMRILVAIEPVDFRKGIDGLVRLCKEVLRQDPFSGGVFVFRNRSATALKALVYDGQGFWLCHKRLSEGRFRWWPSAISDGAKTLAAHQLHVLLHAGDPEGAKAAPDWRPLAPPLGKAGSRRDAVAEQSTADKSQENRGQRHAVKPVEPFEPQADTVNALAIMLTSRVSDEGCRDGRGTSRVAMREQYAELSRG